MDLPVDGITWAGRTSLMGASMWAARKMQRANGRARFLQKLGHSQSEGAWGTMPRSWLYCNLE